MKKAFITLAATALALTGCGSQGGGADAARTQIRIVGSSTVYPFTRAVAERFAQANPSFGAPIVESTGTGGGLKLFCAGVGAQHPDIANASRRIKESELADCQASGVNNVVEVQVGIDGLVFVQSPGAQPLQLTIEDVYEALAATPYGQPNTAKTWQDVNSALPAVPIHVYGPPPTSGTRDALAEMILEAGCTTNAEMKALKQSDEDRYKEVCTKVREDGAYIEAGENDNLLIQKVSGNPGSVGIMGYSFLEENSDKVRGISLNGVNPTYDTISSFDYPGARPLYIYVKGEHAKVIPGMREFLAEYARAWGPDGYLVDHGLIASPEPIRAEMEQRVATLEPLTMDALK